MAFPTRPTTHDGLSRAQAIARQLKARVERDRATLAGQTVVRSFVRALLDHMARARAELVSLEATPGIVEYARAQFGDAGLDVVAEWQAMRVELDSCGSWIIANLPKSASGALEELVLDAQGFTVELTFAPSETTQLRTRLDSLIARID